MESNRDNIGIEHVPAEADRKYAEESPLFWGNVLNQYLQFDDPLPEKSRKNVLNILNLKIHNARLLRNGVIWFALMVFLFSTDLFNIIGIIFLIINTGLLVLAFWRYRVQPHNSLMWLLPAMVTIFTLYLLYLLIITH